MRLKIALILLSISSIFKFFGKLVIPKEKTIVCDVLTLPGWFVLDNCIIHQVMMSSKKLIGFEWHTYSMPKEWCQQMDMLKSKK